MDTDLLRRILPQAHKQRLLCPTTVVNECLVPSINTANLLLYLLQEAQENGLSSQQIAHRSSLHFNTCNCYLRELVGLGYVERIADGQEVTWFLKSKVAVK